MLHHRLWKYGIPFMIFMIGGSYGLREFTELRYRYKSTQAHSIRDEMEKKGVPMRRPEEVTIEKQYENLKKMDLDNWDNKRIQRPWKETEDE